MKFSIVATVALNICYIHAQCFNGDLSFAGSTIFSPVIEEWANDYKSLCPKAIITSNASGARGAVNGGCAAPDYVPVDVANLSRDWRNTEATTTDGVTYNCLVGNTSRQLIQLPVALDGLTMIVKKNGKLWTECLSKLPNGLSSDNIRWLFSNRTDIDQPTNSDTNRNSRLWSELDVGCPIKQTVIGGPGPAYGTHDFFREILFLKQPEGFRNDISYFDIDSPQLLQFVIDNDYGITFSGYSFFSKNKDTIEAIKVDGVLPSPETLANDQYQPFGRRIFSNVVTNPDILAKAKCLFNFVYSKQGTVGLQKIGFLPIPTIEWKIIYDRLPGSCRTKKRKKTCTFLQRLLRLCK
jgi:phosphate transport system substrate-binding protein